MKDDLIARLEAATGPSFALDCEINKAVGSAAWPPRAYTASIDAALTLVPDDHDWSLHCDNGQAIAGCAPADPAGCSWADSRAATPALALCIAALRARAGDE